MSERAVDLEVSRPTGDSDSLSVRARKHAAWLLDLDGTLYWAPGVKLASTPVCASMNASSWAAASLSRWTVGTKWLSVLTPWGSGGLLERIMPTPPALKTFSPFATRPETPRWQITILPAAAFSGKSTVQSSSPPISVANTTGVGVVMAGVTEAPWRVRLAPSPLTSVRSLTNWRSVVLAATVVTHGSRCSTVSGAGPLFPAAAATKTPAL